MYTFVNFFSQSFYPTNSTLTPPPSPTTASTLQHECKICKTSFKSQFGLMRHNTIVQKYNTRREVLYELPLEAINEFKAQLVHVIQGKLKDHFSKSGRQTISLPCLESLFFGVFEGYIHYYNYRTAKSDANQESLSDQHGNRVPKNRLKRFNLPKLTVEWKYKKSKEDAKNNRTSAGYINLKFCAQQI
uniref:C2H2-type domain-containing protein n=1 Tax=Rhizophagus irregularis (strain DAOM 181602 / DAOM 197198 / MUCL 43194) TaxID=747089 RepID=U9TBD5_RHIID